MSNQLPVGAGLGSSSAFSVAIATSLIRFKYRDQCEVCNIKYDNIMENTRPCNHLLELINDYAYTSECLFHGKPSGIDNHVSTFGGALAYSKSSTKIYKNFLKLKLLVVNTNVSRCTIDMINIVKKTLTTEILQEMNELMNDCVQVIESLIDNPNNKELYEKLNENVEKNQTYLSGLGVSHKSIDVACKILKSNGLVAKLTGAGGGGCLFTIIQDEDELKLKNIIEELKKENMKCFVAQIGGNGVLYHTESDFPPSDCSFL